MSSAFLRTERISSGRISCPLFSALLIKSTQWHNNNDRALYSLCLGIVFRSYVHGWLLGYSNFSEIYSLLVACRQHLLSLPVNSSDTEVVSSPQILHGISPIKPVEVFLYINPIKLHIANSRLFPLAASMVSGFGPVYLTTPLSTEPKSNGIVCHALVVRLALCSIVVPFSPAQGDSLAANFRINPSGGNYQVLPDTSRWEDHSSWSPSSVFKTCNWYCKAKPANSVWNEDHKERFKECRFLY